MLNDPFCFWCRRPLTDYPDYFMWHNARYRKKHGIKEDRMPDDYPTIDHLKSKFFGPRPDVNYKQKTLVLACPPCNLARSQEELRKHWLRQHWKSGSFPTPFKWFGYALKAFRGHKREFRRVLAEEVSTKD